jgi:hypothetical protein
MQFEFSIHCIGPTDPLFVVALLVTLLVTVLLARPLKRARVRIAEPFRRAKLTLVWAGVVTAIFLSPLALLHALYPILHPNAMLCTTFVWPAFLVPPALLFFMARPRGSTDRHPGNQAQPSA